MVRWLAYPTELGRAPDEIDQIAVVPVEVEDGPADLYVFKFKTFEPHWAAKDGWTVGVSGPFLESEQPTPNGKGGTFSRFDSFDSQSIEQHVEAIRENFGNWRSAG